MCLFSSQFVKSWVSMEHDAAWARKVTHGKYFTHCKQLLIGRSRKSYIFCPGQIRWINVCESGRGFTSLDPGNPPAGADGHPIQVPGGDGGGIQVRLDAPSLICPNVSRSYIDKPASLGRQFDLIIGTKSGTQCRAGCCMSGPSAPYSCAQTTGVRGWGWGEAWSGTDCWPLTAGGGWCTAHHGPGQDDNP